MQRDVNSKLISLVKRHPCLYDHTLPEYSRKEVTDDIWKEIGSELHLPDEFNDTLIVEIHPAVWKIRGNKEIYKQTYKIGAKNNILLRQSGKKKELILDPCWRRRANMGEPSKRKGRTSAEPDIIALTVALYTLYFLNRVSKKFEKKKVAECMSKWRNIRCAYLRSIKCAANETKLTKPYYLHEHLEFVLPFLKPKLISILESQDENSQVDLTSQLDVKPESSMSSVEESDEENTPQKFTDTPIDNVAEAGRKRKAISGYVDYIEAKANTVRDDDATRHFVLGLLPELNAMNDIQRREFKIKVILLIDEILSR